MKFVFNFLAFVLLFNITYGTNAIPPSEFICGKWESSERNLIVQIYIKDNKFRAKIIWFNDGNLAKMGTWTDIRNPDPSLRSQKILGMEVLRDLTYDTDTNSWEDGMIYDAKHGRDWNASARIDKNGLLKVKGYWHFKFIGKTLTFKRV